MSVRGKKKKRRGKKQHKDIEIYPLSASLGTKMCPARAGAEAAEEGGGQ